MNHLVLLMALLGAPAFAQEPGSPVAAATAPVDVVIIVEDADTMESIPGVKISLGGETATTDVEGRATLRVPGGLWRPQFTGPGGEQISGPELDLQRRVGVLVTWKAGLAELPVKLEEEPVPLPAGALEDGLGQLRGLIEAEGKPLAGAKLLVGAELVVTGEDGRFAVPLPPGDAEVIVVAPGYGSRTLGGVDVVAGRSTTIRVGLLPSDAVESLDVIEVRSAKVDRNTIDLLEERQEATSVTDFIGTEQMQRTGDSNAALAIRRVTGVTVIGGRYVYIRGLGDRYALTTLNGSTLPSPEPEKRTVPLDLFPAAILDGIVVQKTPSADKPAEFGGGIVQIRTRPVPTTREATITLQLGYRSGQTFSKQLLGDRGPTDFLGVDGGFRKLPDEIASANNGPISGKGLFTEGGYTPEEIEVFGEAIPNRWSLRSRMILPDMTLRAYYGDAVKIGRGPRFGFRTGFNFSNQWTVENAFRDTYGVDGTELVLQKHSEYVRPVNRINLGGVLAMGLSWDDEQVIESNTLLNRVSEYSTTDLYGDDPSGDAGDEHRQQSSWLEQQLIFEQLRGHHLLSRDRGVTLDWRYAFSRATRLEPDRRQTTQSKTGDTYSILQNINWNEVAWLGLTDVNHDAGLDLTVPLLEDVGTHPGEVKLGLMTVQKERSSSARRFGYAVRGTSGIDLTADVGELLVPENIGDDGDGSAWFSLDEESSTSDDYQARQAYYAAYGMADLPVSRRFRVMAGARMEASDQAVSTFELFNPSLVPVEARLQTVDVLPSALLSWGLGPKDNPDKMIVRLGYGRTVSRPEFRELSDVPYTDFRTNTLFFGNPNLKRARIDNLDLRWEWYPDQGYSVSVAAFYKHMDDPIEAVASPAATSNLASTFANADSATNVGGELEFRTNLDWMHPKLKDVYVAGNASWIYSRVTVPEGGNDTSDVRPLQGQSPWVVNAQLGYDNPELAEGVNIALIYNVFGPRILDVGQAGIPDTYELPVHRLDLVGTIGVGEGWQLQVRGTNLLDSKVQQRTGDVISYGFKEGVGLYLGAQWVLK